MTNRILVACIGNLFLGDDAFGCEVARELSRIALPAGVEVVDFGTRGLDLAWAMLKPWQAIVLVDATDRCAAPGTLFLARPVSDDADPGPPPAFEPHGMSPERVLALARSQGDVTGEIWIVGCQPRDFGDELEGRMGLSPPVAGALPEAVRMVRELLSHLAPAHQPHAAGLA